MRILITGAAGFIGSHIAEAYHAAGHHVLGLDNLSTGRRDNLPAPVPFVPCDLLDDDTLAFIFNDFHPEVVSHHAAQANVRASWENPDHDARTNVTATLAVLRHCARTRVRRVIYASSGGAIYGDPSSLPVPEDHPARPLSNYGVTKYTGELYLRSFNASAGISTIALRYSNIFGPRQDPAGEAGVIAIFATELLQNRRPVIFGDGSKTRDYLYIDDAVRANLLALSYPRNGIFNVGSGTETADLEIFRAVRDALGSTLEPTFVERQPGEVKRISLDCSRARRELGWQPTVSFTDGLQLTTSYWRARLR